MASDNLNENYTTVVIHINNVNDNPPVFDQYIYEVDISEEDVRNLPAKILKVTFMLRICFTLAVFFCTVLLLSETQVTAKDGDRDRPENIVYFLEDSHISIFDVNRTTGEISVLKVI